jgi:hypothetical protein
MALDLSEQILAAFAAAITAANITGIGTRVERDREDPWGEDEVPLAEAAVNIKPHDESSRRTAWSRTTTSSTSTSRSSCARRRARPGPRRRTRSPSSCTRRSSRTRAGRASCPWPATASRSSPHRPRLGRRQGEPYPGPAYRQLRRALSQFRAGVRRRAQSTVTLKEIPMDAGKAMAAFYDNQVRELADQQVKKVARADRGRVPQDPAGEPGRRRRVVREELPQGARVARHHALQPAARHEGRDPRRASRRSRGRAVTNRSPGRW